MDATETVTQILQELANNGLLLIEPTGDVLKECTIETHCKKKNNNDDIIIFIAKEK